MTAMEMTDLEAVAAYAPNQHIIDLEAIRNNAREIRRSVGDNCVFYAALKGNAYGHGLVPAGRAALAGGADGLSMVHLRDAIELRTAGITDVPILLYCGNLGHPGSVELVERYDITTTLVDEDSIDLHERLAKDRIKVWLEVDTGLERLGCADQDAVELAKRIDASPKLSLEGVYTHLNSDGQYSKQQIEPGDAEIHPFIQWQFDRFAKVLADIEAAGVDPKVTLAASSPVVRLTSTMNLTGVDVGRLLYGLIPVVPPGVALDLRPAFHALTSRLVQVKPVNRTEYVDWADFDVYEGMAIGVIPMGYGDGLALLTTEEVLVRGKRVPIIGKHFEHARLDLTSVPEAQPGDEVIVIGKQGDEEITLKDVATHQNFAKAAGLGSLVRETIPKVYIN